MKLSRTFGSALCALALSGCISTRGGQDVVCNQFDSFAQPPRPSPFVSDIQRFVPSLEKAGPSFEGPSAMQSAVSDLFVKDAAALQSGQGNMLLLSGGGQWGAYGAGLFLGLACADKQVPADPNKVPCIGPGGELHALDFTTIDRMNIQLVTGVSTGGLQSILLMTVVDETLPYVARRAALQQLVDSYSPAHESELVNRNYMLWSIVTGSIAGTDPLRDHVTEVLGKPLPGLESRDVAGGDAPLIEWIGRSSIDAFIGFVDASDGEFKVVHLNSMVSSLAPPVRGSQSETASRYKRATDCVVVTALASAAMPVFHQQLRVEEAAGDDPGRTRRSTLYDGGVRRSVFLSEIGEAFRTGYSESRGHTSTSEALTSDELEDLPKIWVLRNGPTWAKPEDDVDNVAGAMPQALRAYSLLVNELEVGSIATLRLSHPGGQIWLSTADGSQVSSEVSTGSGQLGETRAACTKRDAEMFNPMFMECLLNFGARRAMADQDILDDGGPGDQSFWQLSPVVRANQGDLP